MLTLKTHCPICGAVLIISEGTSFLDCSATQKIAGPPHYWQSISDQDEVFLISNLFFRLSEKETLVQSVNEGGYPGKTISKLDCTIPYEKMLKLSILL